MAPISTRATAVFWLFAVAYAGLSLLLGTWIVQITLIVGFGIPMLLYLAVDYGLSPIVAAIMGYQSRWSVWYSLGAGFPLVAIYAFITPTAFAGSQGNFGVIAPWLAAMATTKVDAIPLILSRLSYWSLAFLVFFFLGLVQRWCSLRSLSAKETDRA